MNIIRLLRGHQFVTRIFAYRRFLFLVLLLGIPAPVFPQILPLKTYTTRDGLLSNYTLALCADSRGYLWIGTNDGLTRYDGISFRNYTVADGLPFSRINCVYESPLHPGRLWIGTNGGGVCSFENGRFIPYGVGPNPLSNSTNKIIEDYTGRIWAASASGIFVLDDSAFTSFPSSESS